jgi:hypothetical protein
MIEHRGIKVPSTVDDWQLYHQPGSPRAAEALTKAACEVVDLIAETKIGNAKGIEYKATQKLYDVCSRHSKHGAYDTEPLAEARHVVIRAMKGLAGVEVDPWSL